MAGGYAAQNLVGPAKRCPGVEPGASTHEGERDMQRIQDAVRTWEDTFNSGAIDALTALYEPNSVLVSQPGEVATGTAEIREVLSRFMALHGHIQMTVADESHIVQVGDLALVSGTWTLSGTDPDGNPVTLGGQTTDVLHRQADGTWRWLIDVPFGIV